MLNPEDQYLKIVQAAMGSLDAFLMEDADLISQYLVLRFLRTSPEVFKSSPPEEIFESLREYLDNIYPFLITFVMSANSTSVGESIA